MTLDSICIGLEESQELKVKNILMTRSTKMENSFLVCTRPLILPITKRNIIVRIVITGFFLKKDCIKFIVSYFINLRLKI